MPTSIRHANEADLRALVYLARDMHAESPRYRHLDFSYEKTANVLLAVVENPNGGALVAEKDGQIVGALVGFVSEHFFGSDQVASDLGLYVTPAERGGSLAFRLVRAFEQWARGQGARDIVLGISTEVHAEKTRDFYGRMDYEMSGFTMRKEL